MRNCKECVFDNICTPDMNRHIPLHCNFKALVSSGGIQGDNDSSSPKTGFVTKQIHVPRAWTDPSVRRKQWKRDIRFGTWNERSLYRCGSLTTVASELARYKLDLVGVQEFRRDKGA